MEALPTNSLDFAAASVLDFSARLLLAIAIAAIALVAQPKLGQAGAAGYHVYSCRTPWGATALTYGWAGTRAGVDGVSEDTCPNGGALIAALLPAQAREANSDFGRWSFQAPTAETIAQARLWRAGDADGGFDQTAWYLYQLGAPSDSFPFDECDPVIGCAGRGTISQPLSSENLVTPQGAGIGSSLVATATCAGGDGARCPEGQHDQQGYAAVIYIYAADLVLEQGVGPTVSDVAGELASASTVAGASDVEFDASDPGSGVYQAVFSVDGHVVQQTVLDENGGRCVDVGGSDDGLPAFLYPQPCEQSVSADVAFGTTGIANGSHHLVVTVTDAAGNAATVLDRQVTIANASAGGPEPLNGTNASPDATLAVAWAGSHESQLRSSYGRAHTIEGRLSGPAGDPIVGAQIECSSLAAYAGARASALSCPRTSANGRFSVRIPAGVGSRTLRFAYREHLADATPVATRTLVLRMQAGVMVRVSPHTTSVGRRIFFTGRLLGAPIPHGGKELVLEARSPGGRWIEFDVVRTDRLGRFRASYRFRLPGPANYSFRAVSEAEADFPFARGISPRVGVHER